MDTINLFDYVPIIGYEDRYVINKCGNIYSLYSNKFISSYLYKGKTKVVDLCKDGKYTTYRVSMLIAAMFPKNFSNKLVGFIELKNYKDYYINKYGTIIHLVRFLNIVIDAVILKHSKDSNGYHIINLYSNKKRTTAKIHRLVAETFIPNINNYPQINHKDENKNNNFVDNLEWCTAKYNNNYGTRINRAISLQCHKIKRLNIKTDEEIIFNSINEYARQMNITAAAIKYSIKHNSLYKCTYIFKYC